MKHMYDIHNKAQEMLTKFYQEIANEIDDKFKKCVEKHGVDWRDADALKSRVEINEHEGDELKDLLVDGKIVAVFSTLKMVDELPDGIPFKIEAKYTFHEV